MSQLTTHILDTTKGKPAPGIHIILYNHKKKNG
jgi:5-hydroxyisourate hydrolase-like protein (transthyretin family)